MSKARQGSGDSLVAILDELGDVITGARAMPMSASAIVNRAEVLDLVESARAVLPSQISEADDLIADADAVLERARAEAAAILAKARSRADQMISEHEIVTSATARADEIVAAAKKEADGLAREADDYCDRQLAQFEIDLGAITNQVSAGRARLVERARGRAERATLADDNRAAGARSDRRRVGGHQHDSDRDRGKGED